MYYATKLIISALIIVAVSEIARRHSVAAGILASLPLTSILAMIWLYLDTREIQAISRLSHSIFWMVIPSLALFLALPWLLERGLPFFGALALSCGVTVAAYYGMLQLLNRFGIQL